MDRSSPVSCEPNVVFEIIADPRRRHLFALLGECDRTDRLFLDTLSVRLAERENTADESVDEIATTLHHHHLPKLEEAGLITYDRSVKTVEFRDLADDRSASSDDIAVGDD